MIQSAIIMHLVTSGCLVIDDDKNKMISKCNHLCPMLVQGCQIRAKSGSDKPNMGQIQDFFFQIRFPDILAGRAKISSNLIWINFSFCPIFCQFHPIRAQIWHPCIIYFKKIYKFIDNLLYSPWQRSVGMTTSTAPPGPRLSTVTETPPITSCIARSRVTTATVIHLSSGYIYKHLYNRFIIIL